MRNTMCRIYAIFLLSILLSYSQLSIAQDKTWAKTIIDNRTKTPLLAYHETGHKQTFRASSRDRQLIKFPRVQATFAGDARILPRRGVYTFTASIRVAKANQTTFAQLVDFSNDGPDKLKPALKLIVDEGEPDDHRWSIYESATTKTPRLIGTIPKRRSFSLQIQTDGTFTKVMINGNTLYSSKLLGDRNYSRMKYGVIHNGKTGLSEIQFYKARLELTRA